MNAAFGPSEVGVSAEIVFTKANGDSRTARMTKRLITVPSVSLTSAVGVDGRRIGYLNFKAFVRPSEAALNEAFAALRDAGINELVLDLRYNGGGLVSIADFIDLAANFGQSVIPPMPSPAIPQAASAMTTASSTFADDLSSRDPLAAIRKRRHTKRHHHHPRLSRLIPPLPWLAPRSVR